MDFDLTEEQRMFRQTVREFAETEIAPKVEELDQAGEFPYEIQMKMADLGLFGLPFPEEYGGVDADLHLCACDRRDLTRLCRSGHHDIRPHVARRHARIRERDRGAEAGVARPHGTGENTRRVRPNRA